jgi:hypothetical protein
LDNKRNRHRTLLGRRRPLKMLVVWLSRLWAVRARRVLVCWWEESLRYMKRPWRMFVRFDSSRLQDWRRKRTSQSSSYIEKSSWVWVLVSAWEWQRSVSE